MAFPHDKQEPPKKHKHGPTILTDLIDHDHPINVSHPSSPFLVKMVMSSKFPDFPECQPSPLSAQ
jgi:hypothetical protein